VDANGSAVVTGSAGSSFPVTANAYQIVAPPTCTAPGISGGANYPSSGDAYLAKLAPDGGSLVYATLLGGSCGDGGHSVAVDASGNAWVVGITSSPDFPVTADALQSKYGGGYSDGFVARFDPQGRLAYATFLGGPVYDEIFDLALDAAGAVYLTGSSTGFTQAASSSAFQTQPAATCIIFGIGPPMYYNEGSAFVMKLDSAAHRVTGLTYLGAPCTQSAQTIAVDRIGAPWIAGIPSGSGFPVAAPFQDNIGGGFVSRFTPDLSHVPFSTYFDSVGGLAVDAAGTAYVAGAKSSQQAYIARIEATPPAVQVDTVTGYSQVPPASAPVEYIAPGKVLRVLGRNAGPANVTPGAVVNGAVTTTAGGVSVTFDGVAAPILSASAAEVDVVAPFALAGKTSTTVQVTLNNVKSNAVLMPVAAASPEVLAVLNGDFTVNSPANPAAAGSYMTIYASGLGQTDPPALDGQVTFPPLGLVTAQFSLRGSDAFPVVYAGAGYGTVAGVVQIDFVAPAQTAQNVVLAAGGTDAYFTVYIK